MEKVLKILEFDKVLDIIANFTISEAGRAFCLQSKPFNDVEKIKKELEYTSEAKNLLVQFAEPPLEIFSVSERVIKDAKKGLKLTPKELIDVAEILRISRLMQNYLKNNDSIAFELNAGFGENLFIDKDFENKIFGIFDKELKVKDNASPELKSLRTSLRDTEQNLKTEISRLLNNSGFTNNLQDTVWTMRDERVVFQVKAECKNKAGGIVHDVSASGQTFFIEPKQLVPINNKIREIKISINAEIERILHNLSLEAGQIAPQLLKDLELLSNLDYIFARARYSMKNDFTCPHITEEKFIDINGMKNPILMSVNDNVTENNFYLEVQKNCLIITGSNTGGKTVLIKTAGLSVLMARAGMHIPAYEAKLFPFEKIFADIGDEQNIVQSLSTFSAHMKNIISIINLADEKSLIILDEICAGTDPQEGAALAQAILENLRAKGAFVLATTHYGELKSLAFTHDGFKNASVEFDTETLKPTYRLLMDIPGASNAVSIAQNLGLSEKIADEARQIHYTQKDSTALVLQELQQTQKNLSYSAEQAKKLEQNAGELMNEYKEKVDAIKKEKKKNIEIYKKKYEAKINKAKKEIKEILEELRQEKTEKVARRAYARLADLERNAYRQFSEDIDDVSEKYQSLDWSTVKTGDKVIVKGLDQEAEILSLPDKNSNVQINIGLIKTKVKTDKLAKYDKNLLKKTSSSGFSYGLQKKKIVLNRRELPQTLDLRGYRVEEALDELEAYLDKASLANLSPVYVIHGHGTGALKSVLREYIASSPYVCKYRAGEQAEGGDGVTVIDIN